MATTEEFKGKHVLTYAKFQELVNTNTLIPNTEYIIIDKNMPVSATVSDSITALMNISFPSTDENINEQMIFEQIRLIRSVLNSFLA